MSGRTLGVDSRADAVRARRARKTRRVERAGRIEVPRTRRKRTPRRRYSITLPAERGVEMQFNAVSAGSLGTRLVSFALILLAVSSLVRFARADQFKVHAVSVDGLQMLSASQIQSLLDVEGSSVFFLDPLVVATFLERAAEVDSAEIRMVWPNRMEIEVEERLPMVAWNDAGRLWWLSSDGVAYVSHGQNDALIQVSSAEAVLQVKEDAQEPVVNPAMLRALAALSKHLPEVHSWVYDAEHGLGFADSYGWYAYFGTGGDMPMKVRIYQAIAGELVEKGLAATLVSVEDQSAPYYTLR